jgi:hypothetical protein
MQYNTSQFINSAPVFQANFIVQPTAAVNDAVTFWGGFQAVNQFQPLLTTAITATTPNFAGYDAEVRSDMNASSHASSAGVVTHMYNFGSAALQLFAPAKDARNTVTNYTGFRGLNPTASGGTVTNLRGIAIAEQTRGTNNVNALIGTDTSVAGDFNFYSPSTRLSFFSGDMRSRQFIASGDNSGTASTNTITGVTDTPTASLNWGTVGTPNGYIKAYVGTQAVVIPYWNT